METAQVFALTCGEPGSIAGEITLKAWRDKNQDVPAFIYVGDAEDLAQQAASLNLNLPTQRATPQNAAKIFSTALPVWHQPLAAPRQWGKAQPAQAAAVQASIETAVRWAQAGEVSGLVTNPIQKSSLHAGGFAFPGHTEFLAHLCAAPQPLMLLQAQDLRVALVTIHQPLKEAIASLSSDKIIAVGHGLHQGLQQRFGIEKPRLALAALNPHGGEAGDLGQEEIRILEPAIKALRGAGIEISGPHPADTLFHAESRQTYDCALCLYHDQGLIPIKTLDFWGGVNVTLGLPIRRTSPDHGTALDIAGRGIARADSLLAALKLAAKLNP